MCCSGCINILLYLGGIGLVAGAGVGVGLGALLFSYPGGKINIYSYRSKATLQLTSWYVRVNSLLTV